MPHKADPAVDPAVDTAVDPAVDPACDGWWLNPGWVAPQSDQGVVCQVLSKGGV